MDYSTVALERLLGFTRLSGRGIDPPPPIQSLTFEHLISIQEEWRRNLLQILDHDLPFGDIFHYSDVCPVPRLGDCDIFCEFNIKAHFHPQIYG
jgi:hypothetical protein